MKAYIDPRSTVNYSSYYIQGLYDYLGKKNVQFSSRYFNELKEIDMLMAVAVTDEAGNMRKIIIDYRDQSDVIEPAYKWSDLYAKINVDSHSERNYSAKLLNITPSFAIKIWNPLQLFYYLIRNFLDAGIFLHLNDKNIHLRPLRWIRNYLSLLKRQSLKCYTEQSNNGKSGEDNYVFFVSSLWHGQNKTNLFRQYYILACSKNPAVQFTGGFVVDKKVFRQEEISAIPSELILYKSISNKRYLKNIKNSLFVFNTPAVLQCHGWKLGEYIAMGKAVISTNLSNRLPAPLLDEKHILYANSEEDIKEKIDLLVNNPSLRSELENNMKAYYEEYASPGKVIETILKHTEIPSD